MATVPLPIWLQVFERDKGKCRYCGDDLLATIGVFSSATVDHLQPRRAGGSDELSNLVLACPTCNGLLSRSGLHTYDERNQFLKDYRANRIPHVQKQYDGFMAKAKLGWPQSN